MYLLGRNHVDEDDLLSDMVEYERLDTSRSIRFRQISSTKEALLQKSVTSNPTNAVTIKKEDMKVAVGEKGAVPHIVSIVAQKLICHRSAQNLNVKRERVTNVGRWHTNEDLVQYSCEVMMTEKGKSRPD